MSLTVFLALCVLGVDFLIYFFFKLVYGEKYRIRPHESEKGFVFDRSPSIFVY
jgi:hypothetical protein